MTHRFTCPSCHKSVDISKVQIAVLDVNGDPDWLCGSCGSSASRHAWGSSNDGIPASSCYLYLGAAKRESFWHKLPRAIVRKDTFAGGSPLHTLQKAMPATPDLGRTGTATQVSVYHCAERYALRGYYYLPSGPKPRKVVLLLSGSGGTADDHLSGVAARYCADLGMAALLMDYRGFGASDAKTPSEAGLFTDALAMFKLLTDYQEFGGLGWAPKDVVIHGYSLGTGVATELAMRETRACGVILQCPFKSAAEMARESISGPKVISKPGGAIAAAIARKGAHLEVIGKVAGLRRPVLVLVATGDEDMREHGRAIKDGHFPGLSFAEYSGDHYSPANAFFTGSMGCKADITNWLSRL